jgi:hypothetical protein
LSNHIVRIEVRLKVTKDRMAGSDDPLYLGLSGPEGREFRLALAGDRELRRGAHDHFVFGAPDAPETNVDHPQFNDPTTPALDAGRVEGVYVRKGFEPVPNVRAFGELDDRIEIDEVEVELHAKGRPKPFCFARRGPIWLGLGAGLRFEITRVEG